MYTYILSPLDSSHGPWWIVYWYILCSIQNQCLIVLTSVLDCHTRGPVCNYTNARRKMELDSKPSNCMNLAQPYRATLKLNACWWNTAHNETSHDHDMSTCTYVEKAHTETRPRCHATPNAQLKYFSLLINPTLCQSKIWLCDRTTLQSTCLTEAYTHGKWCHPISG